MRVLYCNPMALDYRIPFYKRLVDLFDGEFYFLYSEQRYRLNKRERLLAHLKAVLGRNAVAYTHERIFNTYTRSFKVYNGERGQRIPFVFGLTKRIRSLRPDVLITEGFFQWTPWVLLYGIRHHIPVFIGYERTMHTERHAGRLKTWHRKLTDRFVRGYLVNGSEAKKYLMSIGVREEKIHIGGMCADSEGLQAQIGLMTDEDKHAMRHRYADDGGLLYLFVGRVSVLKGADRLLEAWEEHMHRHPKDHMVLVGYGDRYEMLKEKYQNMPSVHLEGAVDYMQIYRYYAIADVFILPTLTDNWSLVVPEAMSCGLPVATSIYNGCHPELVKLGENGYVFDTLRKETMVEALAYFHRVDLKAFGRRSIELEKAFSTEACARREYEGIRKGLRP